MATELQVVKSVEGESQPDSDPILASTAEESSSPPNLSLELDEVELEHDGVFAFMEEDYAFLGEEEL